MNKKINWEKGVKEGQYHSGDLPTGIFNRVIGNYVLESAGAYNTTNEERDIRFEEFDDSGGGRITVESEERKAEIDELFSKQFHVREITEDHPEGIPMPRSIEQNITTIWGGLKAVEEYREGNPSGDFQLFNEKGWKFVPGTFEDAEEEFNMPRKDLQN